MDAIDTSKTPTRFSVQKERTTSGGFPPGKRPPSETNLATSHGLWRVPQSRVPEGRSRDGLMTRHSGAGTYAVQTGAQQPVVADLAEMLAHHAAIGRRTNVDAHRFSHVVPRPVMAVALKPAVSARTRHSKRVRNMDAPSFYYPSTHGPEDIVTSCLGAGRTSIPCLELPERPGVVAAAADQTLSALSGLEAVEALTIEIGCPLIALARVVRGADRRGIEHALSLYRPCRRAFHRELWRAGRGSERHPMTSSIASTIVVKPKPARMAVGPSSIPEPAVCRQATSRRRHA